MDVTLKSIAVQRRELEKENLQNLQQKEFEHKLMNQPKRADNSTNNAFNDSYMKDAYSKVSQSKVTHNEDLLRMNGSWLYNKTINPDL
jgi:hypothetical protein